MEPKWYKTGDYGNGFENMCINGGYIKCDCGEILGENNTYALIKYFNCNTDCCDICIGYEHCEKLLNYFDGDEKDYMKEL